jgi:hypothetical protein
MPGVLDVSILKPMKIDPPGHYDALHGCPLTSYLSIIHEGLVAYYKRRFCLFNQFCNFIMQPQSLFSLLRYVK